MSERNYIGGLKKHATRNELVGEAEFWKSRADALAKRLEEARGLLEESVGWMEAALTVFSEHGITEPTGEKFIAAQISRHRAFLEAKE